MTGDIYDAKKESRFQFIVAYHIVVTLIKQNLINLFLGIYWLLRTSDLLTAIVAKWCVSQHILGNKTPYSDVTMQGKEHFP